MIAASDPYLVKYVTGKCTYFSQQWIYIDFDLCIEKVSVPVSVANHEKKWN
jgi:hypothetical protein